MTFEQIDWLVIQWAAWVVKADPTLRKLDASRQKWQTIYRAPFDPENEDVPHGPVSELNDDLASCVDRVMAAMLNTVPNVHYRVWWQRAVHGAAHSDTQLQLAANEFLKNFQKVLSKSEKLGFNAVRGHRHA